ncbi:MAG: hypothetical protein AAFQ82_24285, partial [Myxococcota bacterium]
LRKLESVLAIIDATLNGNESIERARAANASLLVCLDQLYGRDPALDQIARDGLAVDAELDLDAVRKKAIQLAERLREQSI